MEIKGVVITEREFHEIAFSKRRFVVLEISDIQEGDYVTFVIDGDKYTSYLAKVTIKQAVGNKEVIGFSLLECE